MPRSLAPWPDSRTPWVGDLALTVECRTAREAISGERHAIVVHDDWSVTTPHDLEAERVASAFGGFTSCVDLVDRTIPCLREALGRVARRTRPTLRRDSRRGWRVPTHEMVDCCRNRAFSSVRTIAEHMRSPAHLSNVLRLPLWQVAELVNQVGQACRPEMSATSPNSRYVRAPEGLEQLWLSGIHPEEVPNLATYATAAGEPLPANYFEGIAYSGYRPDWINDVLRYRPDAETAAWLAWQAPPPVRADTQALGLWLEYGLPRRDFAFAVERQMSTELVVDVVQLTGWPRSTAARVLIEFAKADCSPTGEQLKGIAGLDVEHAIPSKGAVDAAVADAAQACAIIDRTELSLMLMLIGNRPNLLVAVQSGARATSDLDAVRRR